MKANISITVANKSRAPIQKWEIILKSPNDILDKGFKNKEINSKYYYRKIIWDS